MKTLLGIIALTLSAAISQAAVLIQVDISNPNAVTFTATSATPLVDDNTVSMFDGFYLQSFLQNADNDFDIDVLSPSSFALGTNPDELYYAFTTLGLASLNIYGGDSELAQVFTTSTPAFTGSFTITFPFVAGSLPTVGTIGDIRVGYSSGEGAVIGQWEVVAVPEPTTWALIGVAGVIVAISMQRRMRE